MRHRLPSMISLVCFEATAKHLSFTKAGEELFMTQSAVSRQVKKLEAVIGTSLFHRVKQRLAFTSVGQSYAKHVTKILEELDNVTFSINKQPLRIGIEPGLANKWLIPKLKDFKIKHPDIEIELFTDMNRLYEDTSNFDVGILFGSGEWNCLESFHLMKDELIATCTPELYEKFGPINNLKDILRYPLLHHSGIKSSSSFWLTKAGMNQSEIDFLPGQRFQFFSMLIDASIQGLGLSILPRYLIESELKSNTLVQASKNILTTDDSYYAVIMEKNLQDKKSTTFLSWIQTWSDQ